MHNIHETYLYKAQIMKYWRKQSMGYRLSTVDFLLVGHTYVPPGHLHSGVSVDIRQQAQAETLRIGWIGEPIHCERGLRGMKRLPHTLIQLIVGYRAPEGWLRVSHRL